MIGVEIVEVHVNPIIRYPAYFEPHELQRSLFTKLDGTILCVEQ
jgi:hypothetical protein